ncbi:hypothetical protein V6N13_120263 [Hibiscus sabdariffa]|uniref:Uncharacterized protein n=1 Tax=Hibiscus sabdariffa TaxID=183260 RepID=A0ABR2E7A3_9ROSI
MKKLLCLAHACLREGADAKGQTGQLQSSTESDAKITAEIAWIVETRRLQNPKERLEKIFLMNRKSVVHEITPITIRFTTSYASPMTFLHSFGSKLKAE